METRASYILIGVCVLAAIATGFAFVLWLGNEGADYAEYDVIFQERVTGLSEGAAVRFNGIQKGQVLDLRIDPKAPRIVIARIQVETDVPINTDTRAELGFEGLTGLAIIQLQGGDPDAPPLRAERGQVPTIAAEPSGLSAVLMGGGDIVASINELLSDENVLAVGNILTSVEDIVGAVAAEDEALKTTLRNAASATAKLDAAADRLNATLTAIDAIARDGAPGAIAEADAALGEVRALAGDLRTLIGELRSPLTQFAGQGLAEVGPTLAEAQRLLRTADRVLRDLDRSPRGYLLGNPEPQHDDAPAKGDRK